MGLAWVRLHGTSATIAASMDPYPDAAADRVGAVERVEAGEAHGLGGLPSGR